MLWAVLMLTVGCSDDTVDDRRNGKVTVEWMSAASDYIEVEQPDAGTRATGDGPAWAPSGYYLYSQIESHGISEPNNEAAIGVYFTQGTTSGDVRKFRKNASGKWLIDEDVASGDYYIYGLVPYNAAEVTMNYSGSSYADGAEMTLSGLGGAMSQDPCIVVGAKHGIIRDDETTPVPNVPTTYKMKAGDFSCHFGVSSASIDKNYLFLLFQHLYAALRFRFRVDDDYASLRKINLKSLELLAYSDAACQRRIKYVNATVTLQANADGSSPISTPIVFTPEIVENDDKNPARIFSGDEPIPSGRYGEGEEHAGELKYTDCLGFVSNVNGYLLLKSTYDVYDKHDNLIRKGCEAKNVIDPNTVFQTSGLNGGSIYTLNLTIQPTYLYVLSEPDLDNPSLKVN